MTMDERLEKKDMRTVKTEGDKKEKGAVQSFGCLLKRISRHLEAVHSTWKTWVRTGKKVLCFAQISVSDGSVGCDIVDDRIDGKSLHQPLKLFCR